MKDTTMRFAGVDWASAAHAVCVVDQDGQVAERFEVAHSAGGLAGPGWPGWPSSAPTGRSSMP
jgi:hypothetical protein